MNETFSEIDLNCLELEKFFIKALIFLVNYATSFQLKETILGKKRSQKLEHFFSSYPVRKFYSKLDLNFGPSTVLNINVTFSRKIFCLWLPLCDWIVHNI